MKYLNSIFKKVADHKVMENNHKYHLIILLLIKIQNQKPNYKKIKKRINNKLQLKLLKITNTELDIYKTKNIYLSEIKN